MPKPTVALKATITKRPAEAVPSDMAERLEQLKHHQSVENAAVKTNEGATAPEPKKSGKVKPVPYALQAPFLSGNLGNPITVVMINGGRVTGKLRQFDQYCLLLEGPDGLNSLLFKH